MMRLSMGKKKGAQRSTCVYVCVGESDRVFLI